MTLFRSALLAAAIILSLFFVACSSTGDSARPGVLQPDVLQVAQAPIVSASTMRLSSTSSASSFASQVGKDLTDQDVDRFIDPQITGSDRALALKLMRMMPKNQRGDFFYVRSDGSILSNRLAVRNLIQAKNVALPTAKTPNSIRPADTYPPAIFTGTGPYIQEYSVMGVAGMVGYVSVPCGQAHFFNQDDGYLLAGTGSTTDGNSTDAGIQVNQSGSMQPYLRTAGFIAGGPGWINQSQHYSCTQGTLGIQYGVVPGLLMFFISTGVPAPPPPAGPLPPSGGITWVDAAWGFFDEPFAWNSPGTDATGAATPCNHCFTTRTTAIAQELNGVLVDNPFDGSCFGGCSGHYQASLSWSSIEMGQLSNCSPSLGSQSCTITWLINGGWYGGIQQWDAENPNAIFLGSPYSQFQATEGILMLDPTPRPTPTPIPVPLPSHGPKCPPSSCGGGPGS